MYGRDLVNFALHTTGVSEVCVRGVSTLDQHSTLNHTNVTVFVFCKEKILEVIQ